VNLAKKVASTAQYDIFARVPKEFGTVIRHGEVLATAMNGGWEFFTAGSAMSYALEYDEDPIAAFDRCIKNGHAVHWINQNATVISADKPEARRAYVIAVGMMVIFEGRQFEIVREANRNLGLKFIGFVGVL